MLSEENKGYFEKSIKQYYFLSKVALIPMLIPIGILIYCSERILDEKPFSLNTLIMGIVLFVATYVGYMSLRIKADILKDILRGDEPEE
ncbi:MAG: hypothetical protein GXY41_00320 [Phycisphaerae bacterium]|nr:hypothetical protein [Phycisphaerae bacterium]